MDRYFSSNVMFGTKNPEKKDVISEGSKVGTVEYDKVSGAVTVQDKYDADSLNPASGKAIAEAISGVPQVPAIEEGDNGMVLKVKADGTGTEWAAVNEVPSVGEGNNGRVLKVNAAGTGTEWAPDGFTNTAGITDIVSVASLPQNPDANTLYIVTGV